MLMQTHLEEDLDWSLEMNSEIDAIVGELPNTWSSEEISDVKELTPHEMELAFLAVQIKYTKADVLHALYHHPTLGDPDASRFKDDVIAEIAFRIIDHEDCSLSWNTNVINGVREYLDANGFAYLEC